MVNLNKIVKYTNLNNVNAAQIVLQRFVGFSFLYNTHTYTHTFSLENTHASRVILGHFLQFCKRCLLFHSIMFKANQPRKEGELWNVVHDVDDESLMISGSVLIADHIRV